MNKKDILAEFLMQAWAMLPAALNELLATVERGPATAAPKAAVANEGDYQRVDRVAVIPIIGPLYSRETWFTRAYGLSNYETIRRALGQAGEDPAVDAVVLNVDSPGGTVMGLSETSEMIAELREKKPVVAQVGGMGASAAYHLASQASEIVVDQGGLGVGSIGVWTAHVDISKMLDRWGEKVTLISAGKYKVDGNPYEPLSDTARADMQAQVNAFYDDFVAAVARGRRTSPEAVRSGYGEGRMVLAREAVALGMADRVGGMRQTMIQVLRGGAGRSGRAFATLRDFEAFLRDAGGCSRKEAAALAAGGFQTLQAQEPETQQPAPADGIDEETKAALRAYTAAMTTNP